MIPSLWTCIHSLTFVEHIQLCQVYVGCLKHKTVSSQNSQRQEHKLGVHSPWLERPDVQMKQEPQERGVASWGQDRDTKGLAQLSAGIRQGFSFEQKTVTLWSPNVIVLHPLCLYVQPNIHLRLPVCQTEPSHSSAHLNEKWKPGV